MSSSSGTPRLSSSGWLWPVVVAALLALVWVVWPGRVAPSFPKEGSPEVVFARDMSAHHAQAVEMALLLRDRSQDPALRTFALDLILTQQAQIGQMQGWLEVWGQPSAGLEPPMRGMAAQMGMASRAEVAELQTLPVPQAETRFLQLMIRHHQGGVGMAEPLRTSPHPEVRRLAEAIVTGQRSEIEYLSRLLAGRGAAAPAPMDHSKMNPGSSR